MTRNSSWALPVSQPTPRFEALRDPLRATVVAASVLLILGARLTWIDAVLPSVPHFEVSGFDNAGDGAITLLGALFTLGWALSGSAFRSRIPLLAVLPLAIGIAALVITMVAVQNAQILIASYERRGGSGTIGLGLWATGLGALVLAVAGATHLYRVRHEVRFAFRPAAGDVGAVAGGVLGGVAGIVASTSILPRLFGDPAGVLASAQVLGLLLFGALGLWIGGKLGRRVAEGLRPMPPAGS